MSIKVGDMVINRNHGGIYVHTDKGFIGEVTEVRPATREITVKGKSVLPSVHPLIGEWTVNAEYFDLYVPHEGKILIMVDEKDNNKIIARNLITNKTAEAKCSPKDEWDFNKGAKLALERLTESERPNGWTGKVVCICNYLRTKQSIHRNNAHHESRTAFMDDKSFSNDCPYRCSFIEYKGEVTSND